MNFDSEFAVGSMIMCLRRWLKSKQVRQLIYFILFGLTLTAICACNQNPSPQADDLSTSGAVRVVKHAMGETKIATTPQRVVVLDTAPLDAALALGVQPIGASLPRTDALPAYLGDRTAGITPVGENPPNLESIVRLQPDLIIGNTNAHRQIYDKLSRIAPTILTAGNSTDGQWKQELRLYAAALGRTDAVQTLLNDYNQRVKKLKQQLKQADDLQVSVILTAQEWIAFYTKTSFPGSVLQDVGLARPPIQNIEGKSWVQVSQEDLQSIDGDAIFLLHVASDKMPGSFTVNQFVKNPLFSQLKAVKQGRVYEVDAEVWHLGSNILGANRILDDLFKYLVENTH
ncbi:iron-siderophore ABC transporter substrate-binding protein [Gloeocapsopsis sp. IPPAS B-1203]|uniref:ABC transporter substrate-binding protein n=1 Tax=Gloeocapsopsis sp. IPPAS B-1203 TaxID=2049454 RepID=UPI0025A12726|nr:iron-siderophore ABC transporter substrate-binding protein [Gloeocapsopsis sp. IPPAS B-1203]